MCVTIYSVLNHSLLIISHRFIAPPAQHAQWHVSNAPPPMKRWCRWDQMLKATVLTVVISKWATLVICVEVVVKQKSQKESVTGTERQMGLVSLGLRLSRLVKLGQRAYKDWLCWDGAKTTGYTGIKRLNEWLHWGREAKRADWTGMWGLKYRLYWDRG